jgi:hypothetical protein
VGQWVDRTTFRALTTAELMNANLARQRKEFLKAAHQRLGKKVTESDCGPDGLDLVPPGEEHALYEDVDGPSFPELDDELPEAEGQQKSVHGSLTGNKTVTGTLLGLPIAILYLILKCMSFSFLMVEPKKLPPTSMLKRCTASVTLTAMNSLC